MTTNSQKTQPSAEPATYVGEDGVKRTFEEHRGHLSALLDAALDRSGGRYDEGYASLLRAKLSALTRPGAGFGSGAATARRVADSRLHVILEHADDIHAWQAFRRDAKTQLRALADGRLTPEAGRLLRALAERARAARQAQKR